MRCTDDCTSTSANVTGNVPATCAMIEACKTFFLSDSANAIGAVCRKSVAFLKIGRIISS
ncbi:hypothetical protein [Treponema denticola]|uniref:hypothetical protein n=1 Tax=Treponema denticola TaxID=158 RepID=UPI002103B563|nr:hypothetical protein [Treponema denticola]